MNIYNLPNVIREFFPLPAWCYNCGTHCDSSHESPIKSLCNQCLQTLPFLSPDNCPKCGHRHPDYSCKLPWSKNIRRFHTVFKYQDPIRLWISRFKYGRDFASGRILRQFLRKWVREHPEILVENDLLLPVPVHKRRLWQRGFNQTEFLILFQDQLPAPQNLIKKIQHTGHQAGLNFKERGVNLKNSFWADPQIKGKRILLFDDVCTTGQTLAEICRCLHKAGAVHIDVLVLCRALSDV